MDTLINHPALLVGLAVIAAFVVTGVVRDMLERRAGDDAPVKPVTTHYRNTALSLWAVSAACLVCWVLAGQPLAAMGLQAPQGWTGWLAWGLAAATLVYAIHSLTEAARNRDVRCKLRQELDTAEGFAQLRPRTAVQHAGFQALALTAGITEEVIFRGFLIATLAFIMPLWLAALSAIGVFVLAHAYQGLPGMLRILPITVVMTVTVLLGGSLWPAMVMHVLVDALAGALVALCDARADADAASEETSGSPDDQASTASA